MSDQDELARLRDEAVAALNEMGPNASPDQKAAAVELQKILRTIQQSGAATPAQLSGRTPDEKRLNLAPKATSMDVSLLPAKTRPPLFGIIPSAQPGYRPKERVDMPTGDEAAGIEDPERSYQRAADETTRNNPLSARSGDGPLDGDFLATGIVGGAMTAPIAHLLGAGGMAVPGLRALASSGRVGSTLFGAGVGLGTAEAGSRLAGDEHHGTARLIGALTGGLGGYASAIRNPRTLPGQVRADLAKAGARPGLPLLEEPAVGGKLSKPEYRALPEGEAGDLELASRAANKIGPDIEARRMAAKADIDVAEDAAMMRQGDRPIDTSRARGRLSNLRKSNTANEEAIRPGVDREIDHYDRLLTRRTDVTTDEPVQSTRDSGILDERGQPIVLDTTETIPISREVTSNEATFPEVLRIKKALREEAEFGQPGTPANRPARQVHGELGDIVETVDPEYDAAAGRYGNEIGQLERANDVLVGKNAADYADAASQERAMVRNLRTAGSDPERLQQLREVGQQRPMYDDLLSVLIARNQAKRLQLGIKPSTSVLGTAVNTVRDAGLAADLRLMEPLGALAQRNMPLLGLEFQAAGAVRRDNKARKKAKRDAEAKRLTEEE